MAEQYSYPHLLLIDFNTREQTGVVRTFVESIAPIGFQKDAIRGRVAILGGGPIIPERALLCMGNSLSTLQPEIQQVVSIQPMYSRISYLFSDPVVEGALARPQDRVVQYNASAQEVLPQLAEEYFDTVLMFRVPNIGTQLKMGLMDAIMRTLKRGGHFIGSGGEMKVIPPSPAYSIQSQVPLPNLDFSLYSYTNNWGFDLQKQHFTS